MILHHYEMSPFSEKIRLMFGYCGMQWQSLIAPEMPPRPGVDPLAGGYRRIPVAQLGADIFCDTRLICEEIAAATGREELSAAAAEPDVQAYLDELDSDVFWASVLSIPAGATLKQLFRKLGPWRALRFIKDRAGVGKQARMDAPSPKQAALRFAAHLQDLEERLAGHYLMGDSPGLADFCAYHTLWFQRAVGELPMTPGLPGVEAWYERMGAMGHGERREITREEAFAAARDTRPRALPAQETLAPEIGSMVSVSPGDYALDAVSGMLVGLSSTRLVLARETAELGTVHVHFPRAGFELGAP